MVEGGTGEENGAVARAGPSPLFLDKISFEMKCLSNIQVERPRKLCLPDKEPGV